jgi:TetR/AcrR family transcriptional regulator, transcriptional repressor for nem operon
MPRAIEFEPEPALNAATEAFRRYGYANTSIKDLERETGLSSGSLYNSFGDKAAIFGQSLAHYNRIVVAARMEQYLTGQAHLEGLRSLFLSLLDEPGGGSLGCLLTNSAVEFGASDSEAKDGVQAGFRIQEDALLAAIGSIPDHAASAAPAALKLLALYQGILVLIRFGYSKAKLHDMINHEFDTMRGASND